MTLLEDPRIARLITLIRAALRPPKGAGRIALALCFGALCYAIFAVGVLAMIVIMFIGLRKRLGTVPWSMAALANAALIAQFPLVNSRLLTGPRGRFLDLSNHRPSWSDVVHNYQPPAIPLLKERSGARRYIDRLGGYRAELHSVLFRLLMDRLDAY